MIGFSHAKVMNVIGFGDAKVIEHRTYTMMAFGNYFMSAPEVLLNRGHGKPADWWCLGNFIYYLMVGDTPFAGDDPMQIYQQIQSGKVVFPESFDNNAKSLIKKLLTPDVKARNGCLTNGVDDIKQHKWFKELDWSLLMEKRLPAPFEPPVQGPMDTSMFEDCPESDEQPRTVDPAQELANA